MPGRHPDDDLLADLAADVLPADQARAVEAHVLSCDRCAGLLEDAERVRSLLLSGDPGPVPADVWHRIEAALAAEAARASSHQPAGASPVPANGSRDTDASRDTAAFQAFVDAPTAAGRVVALHTAPAGGDDPAHPDGADPSADALDDADPLDDPARWDGPRVRAGGGSAGSRRDVRTRSGPNRGTLLLAAAAVVAVVALVGSVKLLARNTSVEASLSGGAAQGSASSSASAPAGGEGATTRALVLQSGRNYRASTLAKDATALLAAATAADASGSYGAQGSTSPGAASPKAVAPAVSRLPVARVPTDGSATDIRNPARLAGCLSALGVAPGRLVAVDLATYEGREAAILLATSADGTGHEIWAVDRTCAPGSEGALTYKQLSD